MEHGDPRNGYRYRQLREQVRDEESACYWCGHPIPDYLRSPHPASRAMEHLRPIALGGDALARDNVAAVHRRCGEQRHAAFTVDALGDLVALGPGHLGAADTRPAGATTTGSRPATRRPRHGWYCDDLQHCQRVEPGPCDGHSMKLDGVGVHWEGPQTLAT